MPTVSYGIANTADDVLQFGSFGLYDTNVSNGFNGGVQGYAGLRFLAVAVPQGANVSEAYIDVVKDAANSTAGTWGAIRGVAADNAPAWTITNPQAAAKTAAATTIADGATQRIYVTAQVQEIVNRGGWSSGNALAFAGDPTGATGLMAWVDFSTSSTNCARLSVTYETGGPDVTPPTITSSATPSVVEGQALSHALTANETVTWSLVSGAGFSVAGSTLSLTAQTYPSGPFVAVVRATDTAGNTTDQTITVSVTAAPPVSFVGAATGTNTATMPTHQAGDLILAFAFRDGSNTQPTIPAAGWTTLQNATGANTCSHVLVAKVATSSAETVGTFANATSVVVQVYRPKTGYALSVGANATQTGTATSITYPALTLQDAGGTSWVAAFGGHRSVNTALENPPAGMVQRATVVDATDEAAGFDTNSGVAAWSAQSVALGGTASGWRSSVVEIKVATAPNPSTGPDNAAQAQAATSPAFTAKSTINPDAAAQAHMSGSPNLSVGALSVIPTGGSQSQTFTSPGLVHRSALILAWADQSQVATEPTLAARAGTLPDSAIQGQTATLPALSFGATIQPTGAAQGQSSSGPSLASRATVAPQTATQAQGTSTATLTPSGSIGLQSASQGQAATSAAAASRAAVAVDLATSGQSASEPNLNAAAAVAVEASVSGQVATPAPITSRSVVAADDAGQASQSSLPSIVWRGDLPPVPPIRHVVLTGRRRTASLTARVRVAPLTGRTRKIIR